MISKLILSGALLFGASPLLAGLASLECRLDKRASDGALTVFSLKPTGDKYTLTKTVESSGMATLGNPTKDKTVLAKGLSCLPAQASFNGKTPISFFCQLDERSSGGNAQRLSVIEAIDETYSLYLDTAAASPGDIEIVDRSSSEITRLGRGFRCKLKQPRS